MFCTRHNGGEGAVVVCVITRHGESCKSPQQGTVVESYGCAEGMRSETREGTRGSHTAIWRGEKVPGHNT